VSGPRRRLWAIVVAAALPLPLALWVLAHRRLAADPDLARLLAWAGFLGLLWTLAVGARLDRELVGRARRLAEILATLPAARRRRDRVPAPAAFPLLSDLVAAVHRLVDHLDEVERRAAAAREEATRGLARERSRLAAVIRDLADGLFGCTLDGRIVLYNEAAVRLLGAPPELGLGHSLYALLMRRPILHQLREIERRRARGEGTVGEDFLCAGRDGERLFRCRLALVVEEDGTTQGFVLLLREAGAALAEGSTRDFLDRLETAWRGPLASLRAAAEVLEGELADHPGLHGFARGIVGDAEALEAILHRLADTGRTYVLARWPLQDVRLADVLEAVRDRLAERGVGVSLRDRAPDVWLAADSFVLTELLVSLCTEIDRRRPGAAVEVFARAGEEGVALEIGWDEAEGQAAAWVRAWLEGSLFARPRVEVDELFARHGARPVLMPGTTGGVVLAFTLPPPRALHARRGRTALPPRPEFYDFDIAPRTRPPTADRPLGELACVVFDLETTGLDPERDEIVQIAAVRVLGRRVLRGELFDTLVDPGRPIPPASTRFHGITDEMVRGKPPPAVALQRFHAFCGDRVLVAHNAAFDMAFLRRHEAEAGVRFDQPVLDTLLLAAALDERAEDLALDGLAARLGIDIQGRHTAPGDALATAEILVALLDLLAARGIRTLGEALEACRRMARIRRRTVTPAAGDAGDGRETAP